MHSGCQTKHYTSFLTAFLCVFLVSTPHPTVHALGTSKYADIQSVTVVSIYDGDSFRVDIEGYPDLIGRNVPVRVKGIDTPELRGKCQQEVQLARQAKQATVTMLREANTVSLRSVGRDKYFRILAEVYVDDSSLGEKLVADGKARRYDGGKRESWCLSHKL